MLQGDWIGLFLPIGEMPGVDPAAPVEWRFDTLVAGSLPPTHENGALDAAPGAPGLWDGSWMRFP